LDALFDPISFETDMEALGLRLAPRSASARAALDEVSAKHVPVNKVPGPKELGVTIWNQTLAGRHVDPLAMASTSLEGAATELAAGGLLEAVTHGEAQLVATIKSEAQRHLAILADAFEAVLAEVAKLPPDVPTNDGKAVRASEEKRRSYLKLAEFGARYAILRRLHLNLITEDVAPDLAYLLFGDTRRLPVEMVDGRWVAVGPAVGTLARLRWLATKEAEHWCPSGREVSAFYQDWQQGRQQPKAATPLLSATTTTVKV